MDVAAFLDSVRQQPFYAGQLEHVEVLPERPGVYAEPAEPLSPRVAGLLAARGIERLYSHQVAALDLGQRRSSHRLGHEPFDLDGDRLRR
jgi:DEAD/DEAH box helicase domain-containing protein